MQEIFAKLNVGNNNLELIIDKSQVFNLLLFRPEERKDNRLSFGQCIPDKGISGEYEFRIVVHDESELFGFTTIPVDDGRFTEDFLRFGQSYYLKKNGEDKWRRLPTLHLSVLDMLSDDIYRYIPTFPRYASIMDNSIWNYYYSLQKAKDDDSHEIFKRILSDIAINSSRNLYCLSNSLEYANHNSRLIRESYVSAPKGHGLNVSPFLFHSETERYNEVKTEYIENDHLLIEKKQCFTHKWRILLLDDHVLKPMRNVEEKRQDVKERKKYISIIPDKLRIISNDIRSVFSNCKIGYVDYNGECDLDRINEESKPQTSQDSNVTAQNYTKPAGLCTKLCDIIKKILCPKEQQAEEQSDPTNPSCLKQAEVVSENYSPSENYDIVFYCVSTVDDALHALKHHRFEIVLLDYLLGEKTDGTREYSYELLKKLKDTYEKDKNDIVFGPHGRLYFSFISAFTTAVNERLLAEGLHKSEKFWHIADGACPTNTPYLFLYNLLHLMNKRVEDMGIPKLSRINRQDFKEVSEGKVPYVKEYIIDEIFNDPNIRQKANDKFDDVLSLLYHYKKLLEDTHNTINEFDSNGSVLATEFIKANPGLGGFLEHLTQLVYLIAFGTVRQWPEMWEEYQFISSIVGPQQNIEKYIMKLKSNNV